MGSGGLIVLDRDNCIVDTARYFLRFTQAESCGKCVPCRVGTGQMARILDDICSGRAELATSTGLSAWPGWSRTAPSAGLARPPPTPSSRRSGIFAASSSRIS